MKTGACATCREYVNRRKDVIVPAIVEYAELRGMTPVELTREFRAGIHARHRAGLSLDTTPEPEPEVAA